MNDWSRWRPSLAGVVGGLLLALASGEAAGEAPLCHGKDLVVELAKTNDALAATVKAQGDAVANTGANLWRIAREGTAPSYLFGTVHSTDPRITTLPEPARAALAQASTVALEVTGLNVQAVLDLVRNRRDLVAMPPGEGLGRHLGARELALLDRAVREQGTSAAALDQVQPWLIALMLAQPACERARLQSGLEALDVRIEAAGRAQGAEVVGLEQPLEEQIGKLASIPFELQLANLKMTLAMNVEAADQLRPWCASISSAASARPGRSFSL